MRIEKTDKYSYVLMNSHRMYLLFLCHTEVCGHTFVLQNFKTFIIVVVVVIITISIIIIIIIKIIIISFNKMCCVCV